MSIGFVISVIGLSDIYNPFKTIKKWTVNLLILSGLIIYFLPIALNSIFSTFEKNSFNLGFLMFIVAILILFSYFLLLVL